MVYWVLFIIGGGKISVYIDNKFVRLISSRLRNFKQKKDDLYNFSCPFCGDSKVNKTRARGFVYRKNNNLFYKCHNCVVSTTVGNLVKHVDPALYDEYVLENYTENNDGYYIKPEYSRPFQSQKFGSLSIQSYDTAEICSNLPESHDIIRYLNHRKIPKKLYSKLLYTDNYQKFIEEIFPGYEDISKISDDARLVIPFYNKNNELMAVTGRALSINKNTIRYVTVKLYKNQEKIIYGLDRVDLKRRVKIVEGPIDSLFLDNCVASGDANLIAVAKHLNVKDMVLIFDNERRNKDIVKYMEKAINDGYNIVIWPDSILEKDINLMIMSGKSVNEIEDVIASNTFQGLSAVARLTFWKKV
jgi:transcription elongation factor Elf1